MTDEHRLVVLNERLARAERTKDVEFLRKVLADDLEFRRADGSSVGKKQFFEGLETRRYERCDAESIRPVVLEDLAVVTLIVHAAGFAGEKRFEGAFRNIRVFRRTQTDERWEVVRWFNAKLDAPPAPPRPTPDETYERILGKKNTGDDTGLRHYTLETLYGDVWNRGVLSDRDRRLITLGILAATGATDQLVEHLRGAKLGGVAREELIETMVQVGFYGGWARGTDGQKRVLAMFDKSVELEQKLEDGLVQSIFEPCAQALMSCLDGAPPPTRVLDVGCGSGIAVRVAAARFPSITAAHGLDYAPNAITVANKAASGRAFRFWVDNAETFTVDEPYDAILCQHTIQHVDSPRAMRQMHAALRPGGILVLAAWPKLEECPAYDFLYTAADEREAKASSVATPLPELRRFAEDAGFEIVGEPRLVPTRTTPVVPEAFRRQYLESSLGWDIKPWPALDRAKLYAEAERLGWSKDAPTFVIGMNVVVARRP